MGKSRSPDAQLAVRMDSEVARQIRQHARGNSKTEVCGVLIGEAREDALDIRASIAGVNAAQAGTHVTFTQDTWEHIYKIKDRDYPEERIVGWYHSHPGFGVFLSDHDTFIHENFFSSPGQVAWVYDPHSDEEGCFGWVGKRIERLPEISLSDRKGGEGAGETGKPEPVGSSEEMDEEDVELEEPERRLPAWLRWTAMVVSYLLVLGVGFVLALVLLRPRDRFFAFPVDPQTGLPQLDPRTGSPMLIEIPPERMRPYELPGPSTPSDPQKKDVPAPVAPGLKDGKDKNAPKQ